MAIVLNPAIYRLKSNRMAIINITSRLPAKRYWFGLTTGAYSGHARYITHSDVLNQVVYWNAVADEWRINTNREWEDPAFANALELARINAVRAFESSRENLPFIYRVAMYNRMAQQSATLIREWLTAYEDTITITELALADGLSLVGNSLSLDALDKTLDTQVLPQSTIETDHTHSIAREEGATRNGVRTDHLRILPTGTNTASVIGNIVDIIPNDIDVISTTRVNGANVNEIKLVRHEGEDTTQLGSGTTVTDATGVIRGMSILFRTDDGQPQIRLNVSQQGSSTLFRSNWFDLPTTSRTGRYITSIDSTIGDTHTTVTISYSDGDTDSFDVPNGRDGADGQDGQDGTDGTGSGTVGPPGRDGKDGEDGRNGRDGQDGEDGAPGQGIDRMTVTRSNGTQHVQFFAGDMALTPVINIQDGEAAARGAPGQPGRGIRSITATKYTGYTRLFIHYDSGNPASQTFDIPDGEDGENGQQGEQGVPGVLDTNAFNELMSRIIPAGEL